MPRGRVRGCLHVHFGRGMRLRVMFLSTRSLGFTLQRPAGTSCPRPLNFLPPVGVTCTSQCSSLGECELQCSEPSTPPEPPRSTPPCSLNCASGAAGLNVCPTGSSPVAPRDDSNAPNCTCRCRLPPITRPPVCDRETFVACQAALSPCERDDITLNGNGLVRDVDSCCGTCQTVPPCPVRAHIACLLNQRPCSVNGTLRERPVPVSGSCCRSCRPHPFRPFNSTVCSPACVGANRTCVPIVDRDGNLRESVCRRVVRRDVWLQRLDNTTAYTDNLATAYLRVLLERTHQRLGRLFLKIAYWWHVSYARVVSSTECLAGARPSSLPEGTADCIALYFVDPRPLSAVTRDTTCTTDCPTTAEIDDLFTQAIRSSELTVGVTAAHSSLVAVSVALVAALLAVASLAL